LDTKKQRQHELMIPVVIANES